MEPQLREIFWKHLLSNPENREHLKIFRNVDCIKFRTRDQTSKPLTNEHFCLWFNYLVPYWLVSHNTVTFYKYFWCSRFCEFHCKPTLSGHLRVPASGRFMEVGHSIEYRHKTSPAETNTWWGQHYWSPSVINLNFGLFSLTSCTLQLRFILGRRKLMFMILWLGKIGESRNTTGCEQNGYLSKLDTSCLLHNVILLFLRKFIGHIFEKSWEIRVRKRVWQGKGLNTGFSTQVQWLVTWDKALFSFRFKNNILAGKVEFER